VEELTTAHVHQTARMLEAPRDDPLEERIYDL